GQIIESGAGMGIDHAKRGLLLLQIEENAHQHDMLDDIGKATGVKSMAIVHGRGVTTPLRAKRNNPWLPRKQHGLPARFRSLEKGREWRLTECSPASQWRH